MLKRIAIMVALCLPFTCFAQQVQLTTADSLMSRIKSGGDSTYIINFWATWCAPCIKELPAFEAFEKTLVHEKAKIILVSLDLKSDLQKVVLPFLKNNAITSQVLLLDDEDPQVFINKIDSGWSGTLPATLIATKLKQIFFEKDFTYAELVASYNAVKN